MAACNLVAHLLKPGDHVIVSDDLYGGCTSFFLGAAKNNYGLEVSAIDLGDLKLLQSTFKPNTKLLWLESPTNPTLKVLDIVEIAKLCKEKKVICVVDNTFMSPYLQNPLQLGADIVAHSCTKFIGGHTDLIMGAVLTSNEEIYAKLKSASIVVGSCPGPFDCYLATRGVKTLSLRMSRSQESAQKLAEYLEKHPKVEKVIYPGLKSHPGYETLKKQARGAGGVFTIVLKGTPEGANKFYKNLNLFGHAVSLGGIESLVSLPVMVTHKPVPPEIRAKLGITDTMLRLSVGIEDFEDLKNDIDHALESVKV
eukprot:TRINITY_DN302_c0_g1_i2.p2 TRINITY_DN302_c0_g1~~TRINITY_DN302_c0_g1_i2.p2  ORF type:complete len:310 (-),score=98.97 TRINITY_DN302_c0_g1_i2:197-1126(-)